MSRMTRNGTAEPVLRDQILSRERGQDKYSFSLFTADDEQDRQPYTVDPYSNVKLLQVTAVNTYIL